MPTKAGCELCDWEETFQEYEEAKAAAVDHDCNPEEDSNPPVWVKDVAQSEGGAGE